MFKLQSKPNDLISLIEWNARYFPQRRAYLCLEDGHQETIQITYSQLAQRARSIAAFLQSKDLFAQRVLLVYAPGLDFITAFLACLYAGVVAVPVIYPQLENVDDHGQLLDKIAHDAQICGILTESTYVSYCAEHLKTGNANSFFIADTTDFYIEEAGIYQKLTIDNNAIAYLQYDWQSHDVSQAVMISHGNLLQSLRQISKAWHYSKNSVTLTCTPHYHFFSLLYGLLTPLVEASLVIILPSEIFLQRPIAWLQAISRYQVTHSAGDSFAYDLCVEQINIIEAQPLKLSSWKVAINYDENIDLTNQQSFANKFSGCGFSLKAFCNVYAMPELTGVIATEPYYKKTKSIALNSANIVSRGAVLPATTAIIVDPEKLVPVAESAIGEIWLTGKTVVSGYWHGSLDQQAEFLDVLPTTQKSYFRTGHIGFIRQKEIYLTGRINDIIFINNRTHYFPELAATVERALKTFSACQESMAFALPINDKQELVLLLSVNTDLDLNEKNRIIKVLRQVFAERHTINIFGIIFVKEDSLPKNNAGKLCRELAQQFYHDKTLEIYSKHFRNITNAPVKHPEPIVTLASNSAPQISAVTAVSFNSQSVAVIGMQGIFPQSNNLTEFWQHLAAGNDLITEIPAERWDWRNYNKTCRWGGFINGVAEFDAEFFDITANEANFMDPQQRLLLEVVWKAIEDAGYDPLTLSEFGVGLFVSVDFNDYRTLLRSYPQLLENNPVLAGNAYAMLANRIAYFLNFQGPCEVINNGGSGSIAAMQRAVHALQHQECTVAIVCSASLVLDPLTLTMLDQTGALAADGRCKAFSNSANGYAKGEGVAALLLKLTATAQQDHDHIYGCIKGIGVNHNGKTAAFTVPSVTAQQKLLTQVYSQAAVSPQTITYIETHGIGNPQSDAIEITALKQAFQALTAQQETSKGYCALGSVKTNIGYLDSTAGIAGVIKVLLAMQHGLLPGTLHFKELNPAIDLNNSPFYIAANTQPWRQLQDNSGAIIPRRAGVSALSWGGTNAHVLLEEALPLVAMNSSKLQKPYYLITLSAKTRVGLSQKIAQLAAYLIENSTINLENLSFTLNRGRSHFQCRCAIVIANTAELLSTLQLMMQNQQLENCIINYEQQFDLRGPLFTEVYKQTLATLKDYSTIPATLYYEKLLLIADLYSKYYPVDWQLLHVDESQARVVGLPGYPFNKQRYWFDKELNENANRQPMNALQENIIQPLFAMDNIAPAVINEELVAETQADYAVSKLAVANGETDIAVLEAPIITPANKKIYSRNSWIAHRRVNPNAKLRLFCFPCNGVGAAMYRDWQHMLPDFIEICPIQLPGREERFDETALQDFSILQEALITNLQAHFDLPFAFFGHGFGALLAFELARQLRDQLSLAPTHLFVSAYPDPQLPAKSIDNLLAQVSSINLDLLTLQNRGAINDLTSEQLNRIAVILNENNLMMDNGCLTDLEMIKKLLPALVADLEVERNYQYVVAAPLDTPISVFLGKQDVWVPYEDHLGWGRYTERDCAIHKIDGGHLFIQEDAARSVVLKKVAEVLSN